MSSFASLSSRAETDLGVQSLCRAEAQFPQALRISSLVSIKMSTLQELSSKHSIPAVTIAPIPNDTLPKELRDKQTTMGGADNEALYTMFAHSMEHRSHVRLALPPLPPSAED